MKWNKVKSSKDLAVFMEEYYDLPLDGRALIRDEMRTFLESYKGFTKESASEAESKSIQPQPRKKRARKKRWA